MQGATNVIADAKYVLRYGRAVVKIVVVLSVQNVSNMEDRCVMTAKRSKKTKEMMKTRVMKMTKTVEDDEDS